MQFDRCRVTRDQLDGFVRVDHRWWTDGLLPSGFSFSIENEMLNVETQRGNNNLKSSETEHSCFDSDL